MNKHNNVGQPIRMKRKPLHESNKAWMSSKYGTGARPWECEVKVKPFADGANENGMSYPVVIEYRYEKIGNGS